VRDDDKTGCCPLTVCSLPYTTRLCTFLLFFLQSTLRYSRVCRCLHVNGAEADHFVLLCCVVSARWLLACTLAVCCCCCAARAGIEDTLRFYFSCPFFSLFIWLCLCLCVCVCVLNAFPCLSFSFQALLLLLFSTFLSAASPLRLCNCFEFVCECVCFFFLLLLLWAGVVIWAASPVIFFSFCCCCSDHHHYC
jgi:hypothetical protein